MIQDIAPKKFHNEYHPEIRPKSGDPVFHFRGRDVLISSEPEKPWPSFCEFQNEEQVVYIFSIDEQHYFMLLDDEADVPDKYTYRDVRTVRGENRLEGHEIFAAFTALHLNSWYRANRFCGSCGGKTEPDTVERAMKCKECGRVIYPRINPAVIVGVTNGDEILMTKYRGRDIPYFALIAGFTEIGETLEQTVAREVMEEAGLRVKNIRYYKSQPWAIVDDLLAGFYCDVDGSTEIHMDATELKEAVWVRREDVIGQPNDYSLTNEMMRRFRDGLPC